MSYIIKNNEVIAETRETLKSGTTVEYAFDTSTDALHADQRKILVNARTARISNAEKYANQIYNSATRINEWDHDELKFIIL